MSKLYERAHEMNEISHAELQPLNTKQCGGYLYPETIYSKTMPVQIIWICNACGKDLLDSQLRSISDDVDYDNDVRNFIYDEEDSLS